ncbi:MAG: DNA-processing protein DprA [Candidatus Ratteibacteria bacterium]|jgi:DNA processing protein
MNNDLLWWVALNLTPNIGSIKAKALLDYFPRPADIFKAGKSDLIKAGKLSFQDTENILEFKIETAEEELRLAEKHGFAIIPQNDSRYPELLKQIPDPPILLYVWGTFKEIDLLAAAIVGTRLCSPYGLIQAARFAAGIVSAGFTVVSGLAKGIDTAAHQGALRAKGRTIAVLGSGLLDIYPVENRKLAEKIASSGAVVSELPLRMRPDRQNFPKRNRIISGLSRAVLVVEAGNRSGALITASLALEQGREVFALPGPVDQEMSLGTNNLLKEGAQIATAPEDILIALAPTLPFPEKETVPVEKETQLKTGHDGQNQTHRVLSGDYPELKTLLLSGNPVSIEEIAAHLSLSLAEVGSLLTKLELEGVVKEISGKRFTLP